MPNRRTIGAGRAGVVSIITAFAALAAAGETRTRAQAPEFPAPYDTETAGGGPDTAGTAAAKMALPAGFRVQVFAAEPDVRQPIAITTDERGRLWVAENFTFAEMPRRWDTQLRDRVIILEDRDGDGRADERRIFWDQGRLLTGLETGMGGIWVLCAPHLLFIPDRDRDDVPDGAPEVVLEGFNPTALVGHNIVNGLKWGPDGWLYGRHGFLDTSVVGVPGTPPDKRLPLNAAIWRYHPTRRSFEVVTHGATNPWGMDFDQHGQMFFVNVNIGHLWHGVPGAYYRRSHSTSHFNPYVYDTIDQAADHYHWDTGATGSNASSHGLREKVAVQLGGGHAHVGCLIYQGGAWPESYYNSVLTINFHGRRINQDTLRRVGNGYVAQHGPDLLKVEDPWFRGIDLITGADGNVFMADWSDTGECHDNNGVHRGSGRIYKISHGAGPKREFMDVARESEEALVALLAHPNDWYARAVRKVLQARAAAGVDLGSVRQRLETILFAPGEERTRLRGLWAWHAIGASGEAGLVRLLDDTSEHLRTWAVRLLFDRAEPPGKETLQRMETLARTETSGLVRLFLASALPRLPAEERWKIAGGLASRGEDGADRQQSLMIWYGIQPLVIEQADDAIRLLGQSRLPVVRRHITRRLMDEADRQPALIERVVHAAADASASSEFRADVAAGMAASMRGLGRANKPSAWDRLAAQLEQSALAESRRIGRELSLFFGSGRADAELLALVKDRGGEAAVRRQALQSLVQASASKHRALIENAVVDRGIGQEAVRTLARFDDANVPALLLNRYARVAGPVKTQIIDVLISRPAFARALLAALASGQIPRSAVTPFHARQLSALNDEAVTTLLTDVWGTVRTTPAEKTAELAALQAKLTEEQLALADPRRGKSVFRQTCGACHKLYGDGGDFGPDLTGSGRHDLRFLLEKIVDPGAMVPNELRMTVVKLRDGRTLTGRVVQENERLLTLQTPASQMPLDKGEVLSREHMPGSMMPEGLLRALEVSDVRDLFAYLMDRETSRSN